MGMSAREQLKKTGGLIHVTLLNSTENEQYEKRAEQAGDIGGEAMLKLRQLKLDGSSKENTQIPLKVPK